MKTNKDILALLVIVAAMLLLAINDAKGAECQQRTLSVRPFYMPTGQFCKVTAEGMVCFTLEEYKKLLEMDKDLYAEKQKAVERDKIIENQVLILRQKDLTIDLLEQDKQVLTERSDRLAVKWKECLDDNEALPWGALLWGTGTGVVVGIVAGVATWAILATTQAKE